MARADRNVDLSTLDLENCVITASPREVARAILANHCPRCVRGNIFAGRFDMHEVCPVCGLRFEREPGYFLGALYVSYTLSVIILGAGIALISYLSGGWDLHAIILLVAVLYIPLMPAVFRYSRTIWIYFDRWTSPMGA